jgi:hypothetical protein
MNTMRLATDVVDYGETQEVFVTGYASITRVSRGVIRETFYTEVQDQNGTIERRVALHILWDAEQWMESRGATMAAVEMNRNIKLVRPMAATAH